MCLKNNICPIKNSIYSNAAKIFLSCIINLKPSFDSRLSEEGLQIPLIVALPGFATDVCFIHEQGRLTALWAINYTVNVVIFAGGKISRKCWQDLSRGGNFHDISPISLLKSYGFYFPVGEVFAKKTISRKTWKLPPPENFHVHRISCTNTIETSFKKNWFVQSMINFVPRDLARSY